MPKNKQPGLTKIRAQQHKGQSIHLQNNIISHLAKSHAVPFKWGNVLNQGIKIITDITLPRLMALPLTPIFGRPFPYPGWYYYKCCLLQGWRRSLLLDNQIFRKNWTVFLTTFPQFLVFCRLMTRLCVPPHVLVHRKFSSRQEISSLYEPPFSRSKREPDPETISLIEL